MGEIESLGRKILGGLEALRDELDMLRELCNSSGDDDLASCAEDAAQEADSLILSVWEVCIGASD